MKASEKKPKKKEKVEIEPDAWERFKGTIQKIVPPKKAKVKPKSTN